MKQILQNLGTGLTSLVDVPCPQNKAGHVLIATRLSLLSSGTERMLVEFGKAGYLMKARQQPDRVREVLDKMKTDGLASTMEAVRSRLNQPIPLGYCNVGVVLESDVKEFAPGDRVVSTGGHAEVVRVAKHLCAKIPAVVEDERAVFTVMGAIGLQGVRLLQPTLGEAIVVSGLGLIGLLCVQILRANGCRVLGLDVDTHRCAIAEAYGAETVDLSLGEDPVAVAHRFSRGRGVDGVVVAASARSHELVSQAARMCRKRGRIVLVGVVGLNLKRDDFYKKEISFQVSASYGPGRYDPSYEEEGHDYPVGFVRWTEQRNFEAVLDLAAAGSLDTARLISRRLPIERAVEAYESLSQATSLGILLEYAEQPSTVLLGRTVALPIPRRGHAERSTDGPTVAFLGAGNYAARTLIPAFKQTGVQLKTLVTSGGVSGFHQGERAGFEKTSTDVESVLRDAGMNTVVVATRHDLHASQVSAALRQGKHVFVEKPLALTLDELVEIDTAYREANANGRHAKLMVGFNRRFAPLIHRMKILLAARVEPKIVIVTVNAGEIAPEHWTQNVAVGGGRIVGEGCHFIDLVRFLIDKSLVGHSAVKIGEGPGIVVRDDKASINMSFSDGSLGIFHYLANGSKKFPKERVEVFCGNAVLQMNNYRTLEGFGWPRFRKIRHLRQNKGHGACARAFVDSVKTGTPSPIAYEDLMESSRLSIVVAEALRA